jgi:protein-disulfide isomerase-like protein with CxxC motif
LRFKASEIIALSVAGIAFAGSVISALYAYANRNRELDIELVKIGVSILRADPKETQTQGAREWAIKIVENYSGQPFSKEAKDQLLTNRLSFTSAGPEISVPSASPGVRITCHLNAQTGQYDDCRAAGP